MREVNIELFRFSELNEEAQKNALIWARNNIGDIYTWNAESLQSIKAFCQKYGVALERYNISPYGGYGYATDANNSHFRGVRLKHVDREQWITGYCLDNDLMYIFYDTFKSTGNALGAFNDALDAGFKQWQEDWEASDSDESLGIFLMLTNMNLRNMAANGMGITMIYDNSTKQQRELNAALRDCMKIVKLGAGLYQLQDSTGRVMLSPTSKGNIIQWLDRQYPITNNEQ